MMQDFFSLLKRLNKEGVNFVIIGGFAGIIHGCTFVTQDIDLCCEFTVENLLRLQNSIADLNPVHRMASKKTPLTLTADNYKDYKNLYLDTEFGQLDCLDSVDGIGNFEKVLQAGDEVKVEEMKFNVLTVEALIKAKKALNRPHDREAIIQLEAMNKIKKDSGSTSGA